MVSVDSNNLLHLFIKDNLNIKFISRGNIFLVVNLLLQNRYEL